MFKFKKQVQLSLPEEDWKALRKLASLNQFKAWLSLLKDKLHKAEQAYLHKPLLSDFERGQASGKLKLIRELVADCEAAEKAESDNGEMKKLEEIQSNFIRKQFNRERIS